MKYLILIFSLLWCPFIYSQDFDSNEKKHYLLIKAGGSFPTVENFLDEDELVGDPLETLTGFNLGIRYQYLLSPRVASQKPFFFFNFGVDYTLNPEENNEDRAAEILSNEFRDRGMIADVDVEITGGFSYVNIPVLVGLTMGFQINESLGIFATVEGGVSFLQFIPPEESLVKLDQEEAFSVTTVEIDGLIKPCLSIGGGIKIAKRFIVYGEYFTLLDSKSKIELKTKTEFLGRLRGLSDVETEANGYIGQVSLLKFGIGLLF